MRISAGAGRWVVCAMSNYAAGAVVLLLFLVGNTSANYYEYSRRISYSTSEVTLKDMMELWKRLDSSMFLELIGGKTMKYTLDALGMIHSASSIAQVTPGFYYYKIHHLQ